MAAMARRTLSTRGQVVAAGVCVGITGALAGLMAATDAGDAAAGTARTDPQQVGESTADGGIGNFGGADGVSGGPASGGTTTHPSFPQPQTRTGGS
jgi:hypothetical protein